MAEIPCFSVFSYAFPKAASDFFTFFMREEAPLHPLLKEPRWKKD